MREQQLRKELQQLQKQQQPQKLSQKLAEERARACESLRLFLSKSSGRDLRERLKALQPRLDSIVERLGIRLNMTKTVVVPCGRNIEEAGRGRG